MQINQPLFIHRKKINQPVLPRENELSCNIVLSKRFICLHSNKNSLFPYKFAFPKYLISFDKTRLGHKIPLNVIVLEKKALNLHPEKFG